MVDRASWEDSSLANSCNQDVCAIITDLVIVDSKIVQPIALMELKKLPAHLKYAFLNEDQSSPVIISSTLDASQKVRLVETLQEHPGAIVWIISDIKGIYPSFCTHKILMEDNIKPIIQPQWRLNPNMMEVVKKKVKKFLDAG